jgi:hypothetical protein
MGISDDEIRLLLFEEIQRRRSADSDQATP